MKLRWWHANIATDTHEEYISQCQFYHTYKLVKSKTATIYHMTINLPYSKADILGEFNRTASLVTLWKYNVLIVDLLHLLCCVYLSVAVVSYVVHVVCGVFCVTETLTRGKKKQSLVLYGWGVLNQTSGTSGPCQNCDIKGSYIGVLSKLRYQGILHLSPVKTEISRDLYIATLSQHLILSFSSSQLLLLNPDL